MREFRSFLIRAAGAILVAGVGGFLIFAPIKEKRQDRRIRTMLLTVQKALQNYHVDEELYPKRMMTGGELIAFLREKGFLEGAISNPWTREVYTGDAEEDWLRYRTDQLAESYELTVYDPGTEEVKVRLDSTENQSLD